MSMRWQAFLIHMALIFLSIVSYSAPKKDIELTYIVSSNDVDFYLNRPIVFKVSVCDFKERLCTEVSKSPSFTQTKQEKALRISLSANIPMSEYLAILKKRRIFFDEAKIKIEIIYGRSDVFTKFVERILPFKTLASSAKSESNMILKEYVNEQSGIIEFSHLLTK